MGCGGSRADAIEPRYYESWTRETESTWLTNTDSESPPQEGGSAEAGGREPGAPRAGVLEDGKSAQTGGTAASATAGTLNAEKRNNSGHQCMSPIFHGTGAVTQRQNGFKAEEDVEHKMMLYLFLIFSGIKLYSILLPYAYHWLRDKSKWDTQKMSKKEVTINITKSMRQSDRRKTKNCVN